MGATQLSTAAKVYVAASIAAGLAAGALLQATDAPAGWNWRPIAVLGLLTISGPLLSVTYQGYLPFRIVHQIGTCFAYALFLLVPPGAVCLVLWAMAAVDWALNRRRPITAIFNIGQLGVAVLAADLVRGRLAPIGLDPVTGSGIVGATLSLLAFAFVNQALTHGVMSLSSRRPLRRLGTMTRPAVLLEILCIASGIGIAVFWTVNPWLVALGAVPIWILMTLLALLSRREAELRSRQDDLRSLQELGLELGAELDAARLRDAVVRIASQALEAPGALLAVLDDTRANLVVLSQRGLEPEAPGTLRRLRFDDAFFEAGEIRRIEDFPSQRDLYPELAFLRAEGVLCSPIEILGKRDGLLLVVHREDRRAFDDDDAHRLETLVRFVTVALSNSELVKEIREMQEQLAHTEKMSAMGMLVSGVAHELNNPLTAVSGFGQILLGQENDAAKRRMLEKVVGESERAGKIVQNLLAFSRKRKPEKRLSDINQILEHVLEQRDEALRTANIRVVRRFAAHLPPVLVDPLQLQQVFLNLLANAEDALRESRRRGRIVIETRDRGGWVQALISDDGPGIPAAHAKKVFLPFFTTKPIGQGTGLGLSICYGIVQEHGGRIEVESRENEGASFLVEIPTARASVERAAPEPLAVPSPAPRPLGGRLLVVDDEDSIADMVREALEIEGWTVVTAKDGSEALEIVAESDFDVLLVDLRMPGMDGRSFFEALRTTRPELTRRVVFATGDMSSGDTARFLEEAGQGVLGKPYDLRDLLEAVSRIAGGPGPVH